MVTSWTADDRRELAELCRVHDQMMAEARANPLVRRSDAEEELVYKVLEDATPPAPRPDAEPYPAYSDLVEGLSQFVVEWVRQRLAPRDERITKLEAQVEVLLTLLGNRNQGSDSNKAAEGIDLPDWRRKDVA
jgi:hypothetical protein